MEGPPLYGLNLPRTPEEKSAFAAEYKRAKSYYDASPETLKCMLNNSLFQEPGHVLRSDPGTSQELTKEELKNLPQSLAVIATKIKKHEKLNETEKSLYKRAWKQQFVPAALGWRVFNSKYQAAIKDCAAPASYVLFTI